MTFLSRIPTFLITISVIWHFRAIVSRLRRSINDEKEKYIQHIRTEKERYERLRDELTLSLTQLSAARSQIDELQKKHLEDKILLGTQIFSLRQKTDRLERENRELKDTLPGVLRERGDSTFHALSLLGQMLDRQSVH